MFEFIIFIFVGFTTLLLISGLFYTNYIFGKNKKAWAPKVKRKLTELRKLTTNQDTHAKKYALIEADKLLDHVFKKLHFKGETMGERLKSAKKWYSPELYNKIWEAHKARNTLVHEVSITLPDQITLKHFETLERAILKLLQ